MKLFSNQNYKRKYFKLVSIIVIISDYIKYLSQKNLCTLNKYLIQFAYYSVQIKTFTECLRFDINGVI